MKNFLKKHLWWIISFILLFTPIALMVYSIHIQNYDTCCKIKDFCIFFAQHFLCWAITGIVASKIKKIFFKLLWIIAGLIVYAILWINTYILIVFNIPITEEGIESSKESFREMVYNEFIAEDHLDKITGVQLPEYRIVDSECVHISAPPAETEYDVKLKIHFPEGLPQSVWNEIEELAEREVPNPLCKDEAINKWFFNEENKNTIHYQCEDSNNVGCTVTFKTDCDTVYVSSYKW